MTHLLEGGIVAKALKNLEKVGNSKSPNVSKADTDMMANYVKNRAFTPAMEKIIKTMDSRPMIVCHNDFYWLNVLKQTDGDMMLIDYEYSTWNPVGWDIANYYTERNFIYNKDNNTFTYTRHIPNYNERVMVYKWYLLCLEDKMPADAKPTVDSQLFWNLVRGKYDEYVDSNVVAQLADEASFLKMMACVNLQWLLFNCVILDENPTWPLVEYTRERIMLQETMLDRIIRAEQDEGSPLSQPCSPAFFARKSNDDTHIEI